AVTPAKKIKTSTMVNAGKKLKDVAKEEVEVKVVKKEKNNVVSTTVTKAVISRAYDFTEALSHLRKVDPKLGKLMGKVTADKLRERILSTGPSRPFHDLATHIIYQQIHGAAAAAILKKFLKLFGATDEELALPKELVWFPTPEMVLAKSVPELRTAGLSQRKAEYMQDLATHFVDKRIDPSKFDTMTDEELSECLCAVRGIGQWTVDMYLLFHLGHSDVMPTGDLGVRKGVAVHFGKIDPKKIVKANHKSLPTPDEMVQLTEHWKPYRSVGSWYMWQLLDNLDSVYWRNLTVDMKSALTFEQVAKCSTTKARAALLTLPHGPVNLPVFMPVGTQGTLKGITPKQLEDQNCQIMLNNTYHLGLKPGQELLDKVGGSHKFQNWNRNLLTDSGGFQMVSLLKLAEITEQGVQFASPHDGSLMMLTPEHSMSLQNSIGADIMMQLDDVISSLTTGPRVEEAMWRSIRWLDRCIEAHKRPDHQNLFAIIQGGLSPELRRKCVDEMVKRDTPGYAVGGLSGGEEKDQFWRIVSLCTDLLPKNKPIYCMGVGYAEDLVVCVALGVDMFDCVFPTRTARFGNALTMKGTLSLKSGRFAGDYSPIEEGCTCLTCTKYTRAYVHLLATKDTVGCHLISLHNVAFQLRLMREMQAAIKKDQFPSWIKQFFAGYFKDKSKYPPWAVNALNSVGVDLLS
ncbi:hypothetical protein INT43_004565, partial [Umbelopsis isabellina]